MSGAERRFGRRSQEPARPSGAFDWVRSALRPDAGGSPAAVGSVDGAPSAEQAQRLVDLFEQSGKGWFWETDREGRLVYLTTGVAARLKRSLSNLIGAEFAELLAPDDAAGDSNQRSLRFCLTSRAPFNEVVVRAKAKEEIWWSLSGQPITDEVGRFFGFRGLATDLTEHRRSEVELNRLARSDTLTGLANRAMMRRHLEDTLLSANLRRHRCAVFMLDLDRFKAVNDTLGHPVGDTLLRLVALRLKEVIGDAGQIGRLGGDEFQAVFPHFRDEEELGALGASLISAVSKPYTIGANTVSIGTSVGIVTTDYDDRTADDLVRDADLALYAAKAAGKGVHRFFAPEMHAEARERRQLEADLRVALELGQFSLRYQPGVNLETEQVVAFEALIRWYHPVRGWVSPVEFIPIAEEIGIIGPLGEWILRTACADAAQWPSSVKIAVNISPAQFSPSLPAVVTNVLSSCQLPADRLELEITEGLLLQDDEGVRDTIGCLKNIGVRLALDDFGTGYSSLGYLLKVPFDKIKIDRSFVAGACMPGSKNAAIIRTVVHLARELAIETTAEGVETHDELTLIKGLGCSNVQGYIYGRPMDSEAAAAMVSGQAAIADGAFTHARAERRRLLRFGTLQRGAQTLRVRMRNVSAGGALIECPTSIDPGSTVEVDFGAGGPIEAQVRWSRDDKLGLEFVAPINLGALANRNKPEREAVLRPLYPEKPASKKR